jgi:CubicO group peptidase (beta-lactamase class C family)
VFVMKEQLSVILQETQGETGVPAIAGIVVSHEDVLAQEVVGVRRLGDDAPVTIDDRFHSGSNAKAMTGALCAILVEGESLRWDTKPLDVFPELTGDLIPEYKSITLEMLLRHTAGIPPYMDDEAEDFILPEMDQVPHEDQISYFAKWVLRERPPVVEPGSEFSYSNAGYSIAGAMVEAVTGETWARAMQEYLFAPLGMDAVAMGGWPATREPHQPWGHLVNGDELVPHPPDDEYQPELFLAPAGDVNLSLPNYALFLQMNLLGLQGRQTILSPESIWHLHNDGERGYGIGWGVTTLRGMEELGLFSTHAGSAGTFIMAAGIPHSSDCAVALTTNSGVNEVLQLGFKRIIASYCQF